MRGLNVNTIRTTQPLNNRHNQSIDLDLFRGIFFFWI